MRAGRRPTSPRPPRPDIDSSTWRHQPMGTPPILDPIDPELVDHLVERKREIEQESPVRRAMATALAIGSVPVALAALGRDAFAQSALPSAIKSVLDFALALEIFENEFYKAV